MAKRRGSGEGSIFQRADGLWVAHLELPNGKRKYFTSKSRQTVARKLASALRDREKGLPILTDERLTVGAWLRQWLEMMRPPRVRPSSHRVYGQELAHVISAYGDLRLTRLSARHLADLYARLQHPEPPADGAKPQRALSATTVHLIHVALREALSDAVKLDLLPMNVTDRVDAPAPRRPAVVPLTAEEVARLLDAARGERLEALYTLAITTGMRLGELLGLTWRHAGLDTGRLQVAATLQRNERKEWELTPPKTKSSQRSIKLTSVALEALRAHRKRQLAERMAAADVWEDRDLVFADELGGFLSGTIIECYAYQRVLAKAGLPHKRFHDLRHSAAVLYLEQGHSLKAVSSLLGHSTVQITGDVYAHYTSGMEDAMVASMDALLRRKGVS
jgi:integrase